jgi:hypothetical protein
MVEGRLGHKVHKGLSDRLGRKEFLDRKGLEALNGFKAAAILRAVLTLEIFS